MLSPSDLNVIVGHDWLDEEHENLGRLMLALQDTIVNGRDREAVAQAACDLVEFTRQHFRAEERLMACGNYRDADKHREDHGALLRHLTLQLVALTLESQPPAQSDLQFFRDWFVSHIEAFDWPFAEFLNSHLQMNCSEARRIRRAM